MSIAHVKYTQKGDMHILGPYSGLPVTHSEWLNSKLFVTRRTHRKW